MVDDEEMVRKGLTRLVELSGSSFVVAGEASNGTEGIELAEAVNPELMIIDVKMPGMNGLEMIDRIQASHPGIKFIVLSGYTDFEYTRHALKCGAIDYFKKPINRTELTELLLKAELELDDERAARQEKERLRELTADLSEMKQNLFKELITGSQLSPEKIEKKLAALKIATDLSSTCLSFIIRVERLPFLEKKPRIRTVPLQKEFNDLCTSLRLNFQVEFFFGFAPLLTGFIFFRQPPEPIVKELVLTLNDLIITGRETGSILTVGLGNVASSVLAIRQSFIEARQALKVSFYRGKGRIYTFSDTKQYPRIDYQLLLENRKPLLDKIVVQLISRDEASVLAAEGALWEDLENKEFMPEDICKFAKSLIEYLTWNLKRNGYQIRLDMEIMGKELSSSDTLHDLKAMVKFYLTHLSREISNLQTNGERKVVELAKEFIFANYAGDLSLEIVADHIHMNSSYFSVLFKKETGENFIDFVTRIRIEKAKELLHDYNLKIYELCRRVGYYSPKHFSRLFKELVGLTPLEYRNKIR